MPKIPPQRSESVHFHGYYFKVSGHVITNALALVLLTSSSCFLNPEGDGKTGDATNFGIFKQNWMMLRQSASEFKGETAQQIDDSAILK